MADLLKLAYRHLDGVVVVDGVYALYETTGIPLSEIIAALWQRGMIPSWVDLVHQQALAGRKLHSVVETTASAVVEADCYPPDMRDGITQTMRTEQFLSFVIREDGGMR